MTDVPSSFDRIIPLTRRLPQGDADLFGQVDRYWHSLRHGQAAPLRRALDPRGLAPALPFVFIAERLAPGVARLRIAGSELTELLGMEARGMPVTVFAEPAARSVMAAAVEQVCAGPAVVDMRLTGAASYGRPAMSGRMMLWPLVSDSGAVDLMLGCLVPIGETAGDIAHGLGSTPAGPRRFLCGLPRIRRLDGAKDDTRDGRQDAGRGETFSASQPACPQTFPVPPALRTRGHLRLVKTDC